MRRQLVIAGLAHSLGVTVTDRDLDEALAARAEAVGLAGKALPLPVAPGELHSRQLYRKLVEALGDG